MTSIDFGIAEAPCCGARYLAPKGVFINLEGWKTWSDGYGAGDRWVTPKAVCECGCGSLFLASDVCHVVGDRSEDTDLLAPGRPPVVPYLTNARAGALVEADTSFANSELEYEVRLFHWRALNHARREWRDKRSRAWHEQGCWIDLGDRKRDRLIAENAQRLLPILETLQPTETLLLGELHRILGHPDRAIEYFQHTEFTYPVARERLVQLAQAGDTRVIQIDPLGRSGNPLKMPKPRRNRNPRGRKVAIQSRRYFFNPEYSAPSARWALVDPEETFIGQTAYFITDDSEIRRVVRGTGWNLPSYELPSLGYRSWDGLRDLWEDYVPPGGPFFIVED